jgi:hypothetical protein
MVQVLPYVPSFGEKLADAIGGTASKLGQGYMIGKQRENDLRILQGLMDPNVSPIQKLIAASSLSPEKQGILGPLASIMVPQAQANAELSQLGLLGNSGFLGSNASSLEQPSLPVTNMPVQKEQGLAASVNPQLNPQTNPQNRPVQTPTYNPNSLETYPDDQLRKLASTSGVVGEYAKQLLAKKEKNEERSYQQNSQFNKENREEIRKFSENYDNIPSLQSNVDKLKKAKALIESGKVSLDDNWLRNTAVAILEGHESPLAEIVKTPEQQQLWYLLRDSLKPKEIGGSNPSTREVLIAMSSQPNPFKGQLANEFIIDNMINQAESNLYQGKQINKLRQKDPNISAAAFKNEIGEKVSDFYSKNSEELEKKFVLRKAKHEIKNIPLKPNHIWMLSPDGTPRQIPKDKVKDAQSAGGTILQ